MSKKQHVSVAVRIRPLLHEQLRKDQQCLSVENNRLTISLVHKLKHFDLPIVFDKSTSQQSVFQNSLLPLVQNLFQGFNCAFLCCGQNKSGKTYTIDGGNSEESKGMIQRLVDYLSLKLGSHKKQSSYLMRMSYIEIYEEQIIDLLGIRKRVCPEIVEKGRQIELKGVQLKHIHKINEIENYWIIGNRKKHLAYTKKYRNPHKSTSILTLYLQSLTELEGIQQIRRGKLHIVDMAANKINLSNLINSPLKQQSQYNLSLHALRNVSNALVYSKASVNIPYKDSKVTLLLRQNLGGLGRTSVIFHLIPTLNEYCSSLDSLRLAKLLMQVQNEVYCDIHSTKSIIVCRLQQLHECKRKIEEIDMQINAIKQKQLNHIEKQGQENQFLSYSLLLDRHKELKFKIKELLNQKIKLNKNIQNIEGLFLSEEYQEEKQVIFKSKYKDILIRKNRDIMTLSQGSSRGFNGNDSSQTNAFKDKNRNHFQEIFDLQTQFQQERQLLLQKIRKLQGQFKFYEKVSLQTVKKQEIDILRGSSRYDSTKRTYEVPSFIVRQKKLSFAQKMFESHRKTLSERKFIMIKSLNEREDSLNKRREQLCENLDEIKKENQRELIEKIKQSQKAKVKERKQKQLNTQYFPNFIPEDQANKLHNVTNFSKFKQNKNKVSKSLTRLRFK